MSEREDVTQLLVAWAGGSDEALNSLFLATQADLRRMAQYCFNGNAPGPTLQPTDVVHDLYIRLKGRQSLDWESRGQFFNYASMVMRRIVIDRYRAKKAVKRGGDLVRVTFEDGLVASPSKSVDLERLDDALVELAKVDPQLSQIVELRFFCGMTVEETAALIDLSRSTVKREWQAARAWLYRELRRR